jgi:hypothetical protein
MHVKNSDKSRVLQLTREICRLGSTIARLKLKGIDGNFYKQWSVWFNLMIPKKPYQFELTRRICNSEQSKAFCCFSFTQIVELMTRSAQVLHGCRKPVP